MAMRNLHMCMAVESDFIMIIDTLRTESTVDVTALGLCPAGVRRS